MYLVSEQKYVSLMLLVSKALQLTRTRKEKKSDSLSACSIIASVPSCPVTILKRLQESD